MLFIINMALAIGTLVIYLVSSSVEILIFSSILFLSASISYVPLYTEYSKNKQKDKIETLLKETTSLMNAINHMSDGDNKTSK